MSKESGWATTAHEKTTTRQPKETLSCIVCRKSLRSALPGTFEDWRMPHGGVEFTGQAWYGSNLDGERFIVNVCDDCLRERSDHVAMVTSEARPEPIRTYGTLTQKLAGWVAAQNQENRTDG